MHVGRNCYLVTARLLDTTRLLGTSEQTRIERHCSVESQKIWVIVVQSQSIGKCQTRLRSRQGQNPINTYFFSFLVNRSHYQEVQVKFSEKAHRGHPHMISDFLGPFLTYLPTYQYPILALYKVYFRLVISDFPKPTYLPKNRISFLDAPLNNDDEKQLI